MLGKFLRFCWNLVLTNVWKIIFRPFLLVRHPCSKMRTPQLIIFIHHKKSVRETHKGQCSKLCTKVINTRYRTLFPYKPDPRPTFLRHTQRSRIQKLGPFRGPQKILRASEAGKKKWLKLHHFLGKNKLRRNFIWEKLMEFWLFYEYLKHLFFLQSLIKKMAL